MGKWTWVGIDSEGKRQHGAIDAKSEREARRLLRYQGIKTRQITPPSILEFDFISETSKMSFFSTLTFDNVTF